MYSLNLEQSISKTAFFVVIILSSSCNESKSSLNAISGNTEIKQLPPLEPGSMVNCVLSEITSDNPGDEISAVIAVAIGKELGCVVETTGINKNESELIDKVKFMAKYMMEKRDVEIEELIVEKATTKVKEIASVVASVVYLEE